MKNSDGVLRKGTSLVCCRAYRRSCLVHQRQIIALPDIVEIPVPDHEVMKPAPAGMHQSCDARHSHGRNTWIRRSPAAHMKAEYVPIERQQRRDVLT